VRRLLNLSAPRELPAAQLPASCPPKAWLVPLTGLRWKNTRSRVIDCSEDEPLLAGAHFCRSRPHSSIAGLLTTAWRQLVYPHKLPAKRRCCFPPAFVTTKILSRIALSYPLFRSEKLRPRGIDFGPLRLPVRLRNSELDHVSIEDEVTVAAFFHTSGITWCPTARVRPTQC
jgi:hypothetical protein